jgi:hypothetical protein
MKKLIVASRDFAYAQKSVKLGTPVMMQGTLQFCDSRSYGSTAQRKDTHAHEHTHNDDLTNLLNGQMFLDAA